MVRTQHSMRIWRRLVLERGSPGGERASLPHSLTAPTAQTPSKGQLPGALACFSSVLGPVKLRMSNEEVISEKDKQL